jgi:hypothetical protein
MYWIYTVCVLIIWPTLEYFLGEQRIITYFFGAIVGSLITRDMMKKERKEEQL